MPIASIIDFHARLAPVDAEPRRLLGMMDRFGIARAIVSAGGVLAPLHLSQQLIDGTHVENDPDNAFVLQAARTAEARLIPFWFGNTRRQSADYLDQAADFRGLELSPAVHGVALTDDRTRHWVSAAQQAGHPVYLTCLSRPGSGVADLVKLVAEFPTTDFVLGHGGVGDLDLYGVHLIEPAANIWFESSGGYSCVLAEAIRTLGAHRVLFGTEYPLQHPSVELAKLSSLDLDATAVELITRRNACRLLGEEY
jgi:predicted TIM-barrel fold metal-dependent hydrolase